MNKTKLQLHLNNEVKKEMVLYKQGIYYHRSASSTLSTYCLTPSWHPSRYGGMPENKGNFEYKEALAFHLSPFSNCQNFCIPNFSSVARSTEENALKLEFILYIIQNVISKSLLVIDIREDAKLRCFKLLEKYSDTIIQTPYKSTNNSNMIMCIVYLNFEKFPRKYKELDRHIKNNENSLKFPF